MSAPTTPDHSSQPPLSKWALALSCIILGMVIGSLITMALLVHEKSTVATSAPTPKPTAQRTMMAPTPYGSMCNMGDREIEQVGDTICVSNKAYYAVQKQAQALLEHRLAKGKLDAQKWATINTPKADRLNALFWYLCSSNPTPNGRWYASSQLRADYTFDYTLGLGMQLHGFYMTVGVPNAELTASEACHSTPDWLTPK